MFVDEDRYDSLERQLKKRPNYMRGGNLGDRNIDYINLGMVKDREGLGKTST